MTSSTFRHSAPLSRTFVVVLTLAALLLGIFAMQSMMGDHSDPAAESSHSHAVAESSHNRSGSAHADSMSTAGASETAASSWSEAGGVPMIPCDESCILGCALMAATCVIVFLIAALVLVARGPALFARVLDAGPRLERLLPRARFHVYLPSLTVLSISRT
jgi:hypothetical protein